MIRTGEEWSGLVKNNQDWSGMIRTGQKLSGWIRNAQDWSVMIRADQDWSVWKLLNFLKLAQELLTWYNLTHLCTNFVLALKRSC